MTPVLTHCGAVAFRKHQGLVHFLLVRERDGKSWVLPTAPIVPDREPTLEATVLRDLQEETGVAGRILAPLAAVGTPATPEQVVTRYFLVEALDDTDVLGSRPLIWAAKSDANSLLTFPEAREVLAEAVRMLGERGIHEHG